MSTSERVTETRFFNRTARVITWNAPCIKRLNLFKARRDANLAVTGIAIPYWEHMLLIAAAAMDMTGLGDLGVDLVIDRERGPVLLELNAHAGPAIQLANGAGLWHRLSQVDRAPREIFATPEERVTWARKTFTAQISKEK